MSLPPAVDGCPTGWCDPAALRRAAARLTATATSYDDAGRRLRDRLPALRAGWDGTAAAAASAQAQVLERGARSLADTREQAAAVLRECAAQVEDAQDRWQRALRVDELDRLHQTGAAAERERLRAATVVGPPLPPYVWDDGSSGRSLARRLAAEADELARAAGRRASEELRQLTPGSVPALSAGEQVVGFGKGAWGAVWGTASLLARLSVPRAVVDPAGWKADAGEVGSGLAWAGANPAEAAQAALGLDQLRDGRYGEWLGGLSVDVLLSVATAGAGAAARRGTDLAVDAERVGEAALGAKRAAAAVPDRGGPVDLTAAVGAVANYPTHVSDLLPRRRTHITAGDDRGGGHRSGTGRPGKTEFPATWSDDQIVARVMAVAMRPERVSFDGSFVAHGKIEGVTLKVVLDRNGTIITAHPEPGGPGVVHNPKVPGA